MLIGNTGGDRMIDWIGEFNTFLVPYNPFGLPDGVPRPARRIWKRSCYALSKSQGADPTLAAQYGGTAARNGEPFGELGMVRQGDAAMGDQNGGPRDPQGPLSKSKQDVKVSAGVQPLWETAGGSERHWQRGWIGGIDQRFDANLGRRRGEAALDRNTGSWR